MESRKLGATVAVIGVVAAIVLFVVLRDDGSDESSTPTTVASTATTEDTGSGGGSTGSGGGSTKPEREEPQVETIVIENGQPVGGVQELEFDKGDAIRFAVDSDVDEEVHLHGYDVSEDVTAGGSVEFDVPATIDGVFEVELEESVVPIAEITVNP